MSARNKIKEVNMQTVEYHKTGNGSFWLSIAENGKVLANMTGDKGAEYSREFDCVIDAYDHYLSLAFDSASAWNIGYHLYDHI
jgi:hypothetical protein